MTSTGWQPTSLEERIDRLDALDQIRQLASRYALAVDTRNLEDLGALFVSDVRVGKDATGREALQQWYGRSLSNFATSIHLITNHVIDVLSADTAKGVVTCRDELEVGGEWQVGVIQYWDDYTREGSSWLFRRRKLHRWYLVDALARPSHGGGVNLGLGTIQTPQLPDAWPSWGKFWGDLGRSPR